MNAQHAIPKREEAFQPGKRTNPYPRFVRRILRRVLPVDTYRYHFTNHEEASLKLWRALAAKLSPQNSVLDIGAFHGEYALGAREVNRSSAIFAFEPDPDNLAVLQNHCKNHSISVLPVAVGERTGTARFLCSDSKAQGHLANDLSESRTLPHSRSVQVVSLDDWAEQSEAKPGLIKMDVEGGEPSIVLGARQIFLIHRPAVLVEVLSGEAGEQLRAALPLRCRFFMINERNGIVEHKRMSRRFWHSRNWLLVPEDAVLEAEIDAYGKTVQSHSGFPRRGNGMRTSS